MSGYETYHEAARRIQMVIDECVAMLVERRESIEETRFLQGRIAGLKEAVEMQHEVMRRMGA